MKKKWQSKFKKKLFEGLLQKRRLAIRKKIQNRIRIKIEQKKPITVIFFCHEKSLWPMFDSLYKFMINSPEFSPVVLASPYKHTSLSKNEYKDGGMLDFFSGKGIKAESILNKETNKWRQPEEFCADYIFYQTPYDFFIDSWHVDHVSKISNVCYIPYATCLFKGLVNDTLHPQDFFQYVCKIFKESPMITDSFIRSFKNFEWFSSHSVFLTGHPKLDYISSGLNERKECEYKKILWTPRWNTGECCCHFFDYKDYFSKLTKKNKQIKLVFRPHPLCFDNFLKSGELSLSDYHDLIKEYEEDDNKILDQTAEYQNAFIKTDILISDVSSMMLEFMVTGKPVIYTHSTNVFNDFGSAIAEGFYWVSNERELNETLQKLLSGEDPLQAKRKEIIKDIIYLPKGGSAKKIARHLLN